MTGNLDEALKTLITEALPGLFSGASPEVQLTISGELSEIEKPSVDAFAGEPRPDDRADNFPFDPDNPEGPYLLTQPPYSGPRHVRLTTDSGDRISLQENEVIWNRVDSRVFTLNPQPNRELSGFSGIHVRYGVISIFTQLEALETLTVQLQSSDPVKLEQAEALVVAVIALNRERLVNASPATYEDGGYGAGVEVKSLKLVKATREADNQRLLTLQAEIELKATRVLREDEGVPIQRIATPGLPVDAARPIDIDIDIEDAVERVVASTPGVDVSPIDLDTLIRAIEPTPPPAVEEQPAPTPPPAEETRVNLNTATSEALQTLETIGPSTAQYIIDDRETHGPFATVEEITRVRGIGQKTLDKIRARVVV